METGKRRTRAEARDLDLGVGTDLTITDGRRIIDARMCGGTEREQNERRDDESSQCGDDATAARADSITARRDD